MDCLELRLSEIVRVALYASADTTVPIPANINAPFIPVAYLSLPASPVIALALSPSSDTEAMLDATPSLKVTNALSPAGNIYTHELQLSVAQNPTTVRAAVDALVGRDFHILYTLADGSQALSYALPNTSLLSIEDNLSTTSLTTLKAHLSSMSNVIPLTT